MSEGDCLHISTAGTDRKAAGKIKDKYNSFVPSALFSRSAKYDVPIIRLLYKVLLTREIGEAVVGNLVKNCHNIENCFFFFLLFGILSFYWRDDSLETDREDGMKDGGMTSTRGPQPANYGGCGYTVCVLSTRMLFF